MELLQETIEEALSSKIIKLIFSQPLEGNFKRIEAKRVNKGYQISTYSDTQVFHKNINEEMLCEFIIDTFINYKQLNLFCETKEIALKKTKKGKLQIAKKQNKTVLVINDHNRKKNYLLAEGEIIAPLIDMGIFTKEGKVVASMYDKYRQINKFIEILDDGIKKLDKEEIHIIDFGCGKSYLTFIVYYYFVIVKKLKVNIVGLDLKEEVIKNCNHAAKKYGYQNLKFEVGNIEGYQADFDVNVVISLHACDTATDFALFNAIKWNAELIFSVPCCQHELNAQIDSEHYAILTRYGIVKERISALFTDVIRCNLLQVCGYKTQLLEFVDLSHTPKNMLIRARKTSIPKEVKDKMMNEVKALIEEYQLDPCLLRLLKEEHEL